MTATLGQTPPVAPSVDRRVARQPLRPRSWRWLRFFAPLLVVGLFWAAAGVAHWYEEPDLTDPGTMSPTGTGRHGSSQLAERLRAKGITIQAVATAEAAVEAADRYDATIFVPAPELLGPAFLPALVQTGGGHRIVLVRPGLLTFFGSGYSAVTGKTRFATATVAPECDAEFASSAGPAAVKRDTYLADRPPISCYGGSIVGFTNPAADIETLYIGASEPFRNDRIGEVGNAALATSLLDDYKRIIWVDVHKAVRPDLELPDLRIPEYDRGDQNRTSTGNRIIDAFPPTLWAALLVLAAAAVTLAFARARRLGPPVPEPLPVLVPAAETVTGRGRLYERIAARDASFAALRNAAIARMARAVDPFGSPTADRELNRPGPALDKFVALVAARTGQTKAAVDEVLFGHSLRDDAELLAAIARLDNLVATVLWQQPRGEDS